MSNDRPLFFQVMQYADRADGDVINMVSGSPDWEPPAALREGLVEYAGGKPETFQYQPSEGLTKLRAEIADRRGVDLEQVVVTNGGAEANYLAMAAALERSRGSEVLLTDPVYPYYPQKAEILGGVPEYVATDADGSLDPAQVRDAATQETAAIVVTTPNNPSGAVYDEATMRELVAIAEDVDAILVSDEVYDHFDYSGTFASALAVDSEHRIVTNSFSKSLAITGFRVGYAVVPDALVDPVKTRHMLVNVAGSRPAQYAVLQALQGTETEYYRENRERMHARIEAFTDGLERAGAEYTIPDGGFYVLARFPDFPGTLANVEQLIDDTGVAGMPGEAFGSARDEWLRFALLSPRVEEAADRLAEYF
ncbi:pyridoxal phosphate-dependent aminotransferase [Natranaeroarchaeum aerophilus]|uniref:Aminotransferase n=1 Tax=Natranaeroarchaeum aerophilus TaxID=2917711 RepID=A0AAE3K6A1_9EURY|nr:pyridoxal phosphate-dependent aminotransferase [Natranaeroarchaeum aerophilus]MCL9814783.1 pyridoxal phosphate-dependent aminotransferase [Natranaeroarchaeum aerophilus]